MADEAGPSTSSGKPRELTFIHRNGGLVLLRAGHQYTKKRENKNGWSHWRCVNVKDCSGSLQIKVCFKNLPFFNFKSVSICNNILLSLQDGNISNEKNHKCKPDKVKNSMAKEINKLRETVLKSDFTPIPKIYNTFKSQFSEAEHNLVKKIPTFKNLKTNLYVARNKDAGVSKIKCKSVDEVEIPSQFRDFVLHDYEDESNTRIIILAHPNQLTQMAKIKVYQCDGTFQCCPLPFLQLYSIHGDFGSDEEHTRMVPLIYVLLNSKTEKTYITLFEILKQNIPGWEPSKFMTDFEQAAMNAISTVFPSVEVKGCYFHFSKNVWKKAKDLHLTKDAITRRHVRLSSLLPLLPRDLISEGWCYIMEDSPETGAIEAFNNYMVSQWLEDESFVDTWCVFSERHRTTNPVESWHMKLNTTVPKNANLYQLLKALKEDADLQSVVTKQYTTNAPNAKRRVTETLVKNQWIKHVTNQLLEKKISVGHCLEKLRL